MARAATPKLRPRFRLRTKLAIWLIVAGMVPLLAVSTFSLQATSRRLQISILNSTKTSLRIAVNLLLGEIQETLSDVIRLSASPEVRTLFRGARFDRRRAIRILERFRGQVVSGLVELFDGRGQMLVRYSLAEPGLTKALATPSNALLLRRGLDLEREVDLVRSPQGVSIKAVSPVLDGDYRLLGVIVLTLPLDYHMAEQLRAVLGVDVLFYHVAEAGGFAPSACSIVGPNGERFPGIPLPGNLRTFRSAPVLPGFGVVSAFGVSYSLGAMPLVSAPRDGKREVVGLLGVAVDRTSLLRSRNDAVRALVLMALAMLVVALAVAMLAARSLSRPLGNLHRGAIQVARGNLELQLPVLSSDEIGALAEAFNYMTASLRENRRRLAARVSEMVALHNLSRAVNTSTGLDEILKTVVSEVRKALGADKVALYLADNEGQLWLAASAGLSEDAMDAWEAGGRSPVALCAASRTDPIWAEDVSADDSELGQAARDQGIQEGSVLSVPFRHRGELVAVLVAARANAVGPFGQPEARLLGLFAEQAGTAIVNARLNEELRLFNERLEQLIQQRTAELRRANEELAQALDDLRRTQAQLVLSERLAGMGTLVAGIAHEVNTPATAIQGASENLNRRLERLSGVLETLSSRGLDSTQTDALIQVLVEVLRAKALPAPSQDASALPSLLAARGVPNADYLGRRLQDLGLEKQTLRLLDVCPEEEHLALEVMLTCLKEVGSVKNNLLAISAAIERITRVVSALRAYSHLDPDMIQVVDIHEGIETTLVILANRLKYNITVERRYGTLPPVPVYVDELNQVWTNLIANAADAILEGPGKGSITIETGISEGFAVVRITDTGPGIPAEHLPHIFEPFFTTKPKGKGTGLGLGIVSQIVEKHGGKVEATSKPGETTFSVFLPLEGPPSWRKAPHETEPPETDESRPRP